MIRHAELKDLESINALLSIYGLGAIDQNWLTELALVSEKDGKIVGFIWAGLMNNNQLAYIDYLVVAPNMKGEGVRLAKSMLWNLGKIGVKNAFSFNRLDGTKNSIEALRINNAVGMRSDMFGYTFLIGDVESEAKKWAQ